MTDDGKTTERLLHELDAGILLDAVHSSIVVHDDKGRIIWTNPTAERLLASGRATIAGLPADQESYAFFRDDGTELPPNDYPVSVVLETGRSVENMVLGIAPPGVSEILWLLVHAEPLFVGEDRRTFVVVTSADFTDRKRNKDWESNRNRQLLETAEILSNQGSWEWDIVNDRWTFSENWLRIHGCRATGISHEELMAIAHPDDRARIDNAFQAALAGGDAYSIEHRIIRQDDQSIHVVNALGEVCFDEHGQPLKMFGVAQDITERKQAEEARKEADRRFRIAQDMSPDGFTILRPVREESGQIEDFVWVYENAAIARLNGTDPEAVVGQRLLDVFPGQRGSPFFSAYQRVAESGEPTTFEDRYSGESISEPTWFRVVVVPMGGDIAVLAQDITERKRTEDLQKALLQILEASLASESIKALAERIHLTVSRMMDARNFFLASYDKNTETYTFPYFADERDSGTMDLSKPIKVGRGFTEYVRRSKKPLLINKALVQDLVDRGEVEIIGSRSESWMGVPLFDGDEVMGVVVVQSYSDPEAYSEEDLSILSFVSGHISMVLKKVQAEEARLRSESLLKKAQDLGRIGTWELDLQKNELVWTDEVYRIFGVPKGTPASYETFLEQVHPEDRELIDREWKAAVAGKPYNVEHRVLVDGQIKWVHQEAELIRNAAGVPIRGTGFTQDITERKRAEEEIKDSRDRLRDLTTRLDQVREEERKALARELHDDVGQNLTALRIDLSGIEREIPDEMKHLTDRLASMIALTQDSVDRLNRLSSELRSPILDMLGLEDAVESEVWDYQERWNTQIELEMDLGGIEASPDRDLTVYRILKESLANVSRHARASRIEVKLRVMDGSLELKVLDDGVGITESQSSGPDSFGLIGMSERAERVGGKVEIQRGEEGGTLVRAVIPVQLGNGGST